MYKLCIFDLDGTLTNTLDSLLISVNETLDEMALPHITADQCRMFVGNGSRVLMEKSLEAAGDAQVLRLDESMEIYERIFKKKCTYHVAPYDGILNLLSDMKRMGIKLAVLSNKPEREALNVVESIFGEETFDRICGQRTDVPKKPDPAAALFIAEELGVLPEETLYVGDSEVDIATGMAAGMTTVGVSWGYRGRDMLKEAGARRIIDCPAELVEILHRI